MQYLKSLSFRQLQIFASAANTLNFARTSEALFLTQPAVSMQIKQMEDMVGLPLFERSGRKVRLTHAGETLRDCATQMLDLWRGTDERIAGLHGLERGRVTLGIVSTAKYFAPKLLGMFKRTHPGIEVRLSLYNRETILEALRTGTVDLTIMGQPPVDIAVVAVALADHPSVVIASVAHPLARREHLRVTELAQEPFIGREIGSGTRSSMERFFAGYGVQPRFEFELTSNESMKQAVMAGMGLAFISLHTIGLEYRTGNLAILDVEGLPLIRRWMMVQLEEKRLSPAAEAFREFLIAETGGYLESHFPDPSSVGHSEASFMRRAFARDML